MINGFKFLCIVIPRHRKMGMFSFPWLNHEDLHCFLCNQSAVSPTPTQALEFRSLVKGL